MITTDRSRNRRGVLLLVVLGLLAMFAMIAVAFVTVTGHARQSAEAFRRGEEYVDSPSDLLHQIALDVFKGSGPSNPNSPLAGMSLLEDMYGNRTATGQITGGINAVAGGQILEMQTSLGNSYRYVGRVLTMLDGPAAGKSTHIIGVGSGGGIQILAFHNVRTVDLANYLSSGNRLPFIVNGAPFSGTGWGYNSGSGRTDRARSGVGPVALLPNSPDDHLNPMFNDQANEDHDAVTYQDPPLAAVLPDGTVFAPSYHRPALVNYWQNQGSWGNPEVQRRVMFRPIQADHPNFTGSNPMFNPISGPWDVDSDGDGIPDSIWVDVGLPVRCTADGRLYKPLAAILCVDLDGRLNFNAHGNVFQTDDNNYYSSLNTSQSPFPNAGAFRFAGGAQGSAGAMLPRGLGTGTAEINLRGMFPSGQDYRTMLVGGMGSAGRPWEGRYGFTGVPGYAGDDPLSMNRWFEYPFGYWNFAGVSAYGTPPDINGNGAVGLDLRGVPLFVRMGEDGEWINEAYEVNLSRHGVRQMFNNGGSYATVDNPFTPGELERVLRPFDVDAGQLSGRLAELVPGLIDRRHEVTTESFDLPCPNIALPYRSRGSARYVEHITDALGAMGAPSDYARLTQLFAPETLAGLRMDLNRPFGNGRDNDNDLVVDEPGSSAGEASMDQLSLYGSAVVRFDADNDGMPDADSEWARQIYARHLYTLLMVVTDDVSMDYAQQMLGLAQRPSNWTKEKAKARLCAQWAVNVVDFRDRDSIMTRFPYDPNPLDGWNPTGSEEFTVWGCERPEMLISETLAWHNRRSEDLSNEQWDGQGPESQAGTTTETDPAKKDKDFDQRVLPQGPLFIELYNPQTRAAARPAELYHNGGAWSDGVILNKQAPGGQPVWQLAIVAGTQWNRDTNDPVVGNRPTVLRCIRFVSVPNPDSQVKVTYFPSTYNPGNGVMPGHYAVVGPGTHGGVTNVSKHNSNPNNSRRVYLAQNNAVEVQNNAWSEDPPVNVRKASTVVLIDRASTTAGEARMPSVSEPYDGYSPSSHGVWNGTEFTPPVDKPLDESPAAGGSTAVLQTGTTPRFAVVHLQRLANPMKAYHPVTNPYITIDSMPIDLVKYNGEDFSPDPRDSRSTIMFSSHERGVFSNQRNIWEQRLDSRPVTLTERESPIMHQFPYKLVHSLGALNRPFGPRRTSGQAEYHGDPAQGPFPWLTWNDRPFISQYELMLVPGASPSRLLSTFKLGPPTYNPYSSNTATTTPFAHLMNFFRSDAPEATGAPEFHRLLEFVHVPSQYVGTTLQGRAEYFQGGSGHKFHPPFNRIPRYREPGRVNINTVFSRDVWAGLMNYYPYMNPNDAWKWDEFVISRRGYSSSGGITGMNSSMPTRFGNPVRSFAGASLVPLASMKAAIGNEINATLLRKSPANGATPLFAHQSYQPHDDTARNPYFRYQPLQRMGNLVTTRSNVYAVWITVGYFAVEPYGAVNKEHPDGYALAQELGSDTGDSSRHRAFYIFDRSIPVGFQRGEDHNVEDAILIRRFIE